MAFVLSITNWPSDAPWRNTEWTKQRKRAVVVVARKGSWKFYGSMEGRKEMLLITLAIYQIDHFTIDQCMDRQIFITVTGHEIGPWWVWSIGFRFLWNCWAEAEGIGANCESNSYTSKYRNYEKKSISMCITWVLIALLNRKERQEIWEKRTSRKPNRNFFDTRISMTSNKYSCKAKFMPIFHTKP